MVEFNFNISSIFPEEISIIGQDLIPSGYKGDTNYVFLKQKVSRVRSQNCQSIRLLSL